MQPAREIFLEGVIRRLMVKINGLKATIEYQDEILEWNNETFCKMGFCATPDSTNPDSVDSSPLKIDAQVEGSCSEVRSQLEKIDELSKNVDSTSETLADVDSENSEPDSDIKGTQSQPGKAQFEIQQLKHMLEQAQKATAVEIARAVQAETDVQNMRPLCFLGVDIRVRRMVYDKIFADRTADCLRGIFTGDRAAHGGCGLEDALIIVQWKTFKDFEPWYVRFYGFTPDLALQMRTCTIFIKILDWRGSMRNFLKSGYELSAFQTAFDNVFRRSPLSAHYYDEECKEVVDVTAINAFLHGDAVAETGFYRMKEEYEREKAIDDARHAKRRQMNRAFDRSQQYPIPWPDQPRDGKTSL